MRRLILLLLACALCACAKNAPQPAYSPRAEAPIADLREFPQNLDVYAREAGPNKRLLPEGAQAALNRSFINIYFGPWQMAKPTISRREFKSVFGRARGYKANGQPWTQPEWDAIAANARPGAYPSRAMPGITLRQANLREMPTAQPRYSKPTPDPAADPFDYLQYSLLPPGMPLLIAHASADGQWLYIECPIAGGWVEAADVAPVDAAFMREWRAGDFAALIRDKVPLPGTGRGGGDSAAGIGAILPLAKSGAGGSLFVLVPVREKSGMAATAEIPLARKDAAIMPMQLTPANVAAVGNAMIGQPYGWGGMLANRDCSSMIRDLFAPFGLWLPRNSAHQAKSGAVVRLEGMAPSEKAAAILRDGQPFLSLVGLPGHITLYVGAWKGRPALFHNVWGVRIVKDGNDDERQVIGKAVVTSISPGLELENLYRPRTFADRIRSLTTLGRR